MKNFPTVFVQYQYSGYTITVKNIKNSSCFVATILRKAQAFCYVFMSSPVLFYRAASFLLAVPGV